jgi:hypothetical protein
MTFSVIAPVSLMALVLLASALAMRHGITRVSNNRERRLEGDIAAKLLSAVLSHRRSAQIISRSTAR